MKPFGGPVGASPVLDDRFVRAALAAARCWRVARDNGKAPQPLLSARLAPSGLALLVPAFDSVLGFSEVALGRPFDVGSAGRRSPDERRLLAWISLADIAAPFPAPGGSAGLRAALTAGLASLRWLYRTAGPLFDREDDVRRLHQGGHF